MAKGTVLIVEDQEDLVSAVSERLEAEGISTMVAMSAEEALKKIEENKPDVMLLDFLLPGGMNGIEMLKELKKMHLEPKIKVIMLSNIDDPEDLKSAWDYDIEEYLVKTDWRLDDVVAKIKRLI